MAATKRAAVYLRVSTDRQTVRNQLGDAAQKDERPGEHRLTVFRRAVRNAPQA